MKNNKFRRKIERLIFVPYVKAVNKPDGEWVFGYVFSDLGATS